jgi:hypothetical protein
VQSAKRHQYQVSFATIPLDMWMVHQPTAKLFRENRELITLLVHGNDHTNRELAQARSQQDRLRIAAQAIRRVDRFERQSGVGVARLMAAPHGACSEGMAMALLRVGFEGACISRGSIMSYNRDRNWSPAVGLKLAEFLGGGLPIMHRIPLARDRRTDIVLAAFMRQAIITVGHHQDVSEGCGLLEELAGFINGLGRVHWENPQQIARSNFLQWRFGDTLRILTFARRFRINVPEWVQKIQIDRAWGEQDDLAITTRSEQNSEPIMHKAGRGSLSLSSEGAGVIDVDYRHPDLIDVESMKPPPRTIWPIIRRILAEGRDRMSMLLPKSL